MALEIEIVTLFPEMVAGPLAASIPGRIQEQGLATVRVHDLRAWGLGRTATITPFWSRWSARRCSLRSSSPPGA